MTYKQVIDKLYSDYQIENEEGITLFNIVVSGRFVNTREIKFAVLEWDHRYNTWTHPRNTRLMNVSLREAVNFVRSQCKKRYQ
jgi:hypothetical protein